ncbi:MAG: TonB-dependent receptor [Flavobacteriales bacterium]|nr:TonB-dependent receptor [Flavobacteriales bacterium]
MKYWSFLCGALIASFTASGQDAVLSGKITDSKSGETLVGVNVVHGPGQGTATDVNGNYRVELPAGSYKLAISFVGYATREEQITLGAGEHRKLDLALDPATAELDMVVVTAGKFEQRVGEVSQSLSVLRPEVVQNKNVTNVSEVLGQVPGVVIIDEDPQIRAGSGFSYGAGSRVMVLVDDLPILSGDIGRVSWSVIPTENLEQVEVIKGASSVLYGSAALSGVINVRTAYPRAEPTTRVNAFIGAYDAPKRKEAKWWTGRGPLIDGINVFHSQQYGPLDLVLGANIVQDDGYIGPEAVGKDVAHKDDLKYQEPAGYDRRARANVGVRWRNRKVKGLNYGVNANAIRASNTSVFIWDDIDSNLYVPENGTVTRTEGVQYYVDPFINYVSAQNTKHSLRMRYYDQDFDNSGNQSNASHFIYGEYQIQQKADLLGETVLTGGIVGQRTRSVAALYSGNPDGNEVNTATNTAAYLQVDKKFFREKLAISAGVRYERFKVNQDEQSTPVFRAGATYRVLKGTFLRASYGQGFRFPTIGERYITTNVGSLKIYPNPDLDPEESWNVEAGVKQGFKLGGITGYLDLVGYQQKFHNYIEFTFNQWETPTIQNLLGLGFRSVNTGDARVRGIEAELAGKGTIGPIGLTFLMGYTYSRPISTTPDQEYNYVEAPNVSFDHATYANSSSDTTNYILKFRVEHLFRSDIQADWKRWSAGFSVRYNSHVRNVDNIFILLDKEPNPSTSLHTGISEWMQTHRSGDTIVDARLGVKVGKHNKVSFIVNNLLDLEYAIRPLTVEAPRMFQLQWSTHI